MLLLITYEPAQAIGGMAAANESSASNVKQAINEHALDQLQPLRSRWLVQTDEDVDVWTRRLSAFIGGNDRLLVVRVVGRANGALPGDNWEWINRQST